MLGTRYISAVGVRSCQLNVCVSWKFVEIGPSSRLGLVSVHIHWPHDREADARSKWPAGANADAPTVAEVPPAGRME